MCELMRFHSRKRAGCQTDVDIYGASRWVRGPHGSDQSNRHSGMLTRKTSQSVQQPLPCEPEGYTDDELLLSPVSEQFAKGSLEPLERLTACRGQRFASRRQSQ